MAIISSATILRANVGLTKIGEIYPIIFFSKMGGGFIGPQAIYRKAIKTLTHQMQISLRIGRGIINVFKQYCLWGDGVALKLHYRLKYFYKI